MKLQNILVTTAICFFSIGAVGADYSSASLRLDTLSPDAASAMRFLYDYMPLPDRSAYSPEFILANVEASIKARTEMPWGKIVPDREWRHFVLPIRVNNENLDLSRPAFYEELKERVRGLSMEEAILEVNHWCHEKATYQPSDARTSSPQSTVSQAIGRCGEESTFTVAALRSVGIPARQIYTPRWAHTDDNHAWVEAWANGKWHFIGACEPAPILDMAWFNAPAARGLLMSTNVFGRYDGPEEVLKRDSVTTTINVTGNYAPTVVIHAKAVYPDGTPAKNARMNFCIYNYAEFYPAVSRSTDADGKASLLCGEGDMIVWASDGTKFGFAKARPADGEVTVTLDRDRASTGGFDLDIAPPRQSGSLPVPAAEAEQANGRRLAVEDSIRNAYTSTFFTAEQALTLAGEIGVSPDALAKILPEARGNGAALLGFLKSLEPSQRPLAIRLLSVISEKDRRDIQLEVLKDHLLNTPSSTTPLSDDYILNPRIENEGLTPYKSFFQAEVDPKLQKEYRENPAKLAEWVGKSIAIDTLTNPQQLRMDPRAAWRTALADRRSRNILFVAMARSLGIPARIDPVTAKTQYADGDGDWLDVNFEEVNVVNNPRGFLKLGFKPQGRIENPKYYSQFSIQKIENGVPRQLEFDEGAGLAEIAPDSLALDAGQYLLLTGQRLADGAVLAHGEIFSIYPDRTTEVPLAIRQNPEKLQVIGSLNAENIYHDVDSDSDRSILSTTGRGYYVLAMVSPNSEPTAHLLNDLAPFKEELDQLGNKFVVMFKSGDEYSRFDRKAFNRLPEATHFGIDTNGVSMKELAESLKIDPRDTPVVVIADTFNRVVFLSTGYSIGTGEKLTHALRDLNTK